MIFSSAVLYALPDNSAVSPALEKIPDVSNGRTVVVALHGVLEAARGYSEIYRFLTSHLLSESIDQSAGETVSSAYTVYDLYVVLIGEIVLASLSVIEHRAPAITAR